MRSFFSRGGWLTFLLAACGGGAATGSSPANSAPVAQNAKVNLDGGIPKNYELVWADEFEKDGLPDDTKWDYDTRQNKAGWWDGKLQYFGRARLENTRIENGVLVLEARKERVESAADYGGQEYSSGSLTTLGRKSWTYYASETRAKLACGKGLLSAIWMQSDTMVWPQDGEIDILESLGYAPDTIYSTIHTSAFNHKNGTQVGSQYTSSSACNEWHRYQSLWTPDGLLIGMDDRWYFKFSNLYPDDPTRWPFNQAFHFRLTLDVGGSWAGSQGVPDASFPGRMEVDYVRIYQAPAP